MESNGGGCGRKCRKMWKIMDDDVEVNGGVGGG